MTKICHDFVIVEPEVSTGILKTHNDSIHTGIVKDFGQGYYTDNGEFVQVTDLDKGDKVLFTQQLELEVNGEKIYVTRYRDIIRIEDGTQV